MIYLDNSATSPIAQEVFEAMRPYLQEEYGNPSSKYYLLAAHAADAVENSREWVAKLIHAKPEEIIFTCGSTESSNMIIKGVADYKKYYEKKGNHIITSKVEHHATLNTCRFLNGDIYSNQDATFSLFGKVPKVDRGYEVTFLDVNKYGQVTPESFEKAIRPTTTLASFIWANNEIGSLNDMDALVTVAHKHHVLLHADATQIAGKLPINVDQTKVDFLSLSAHKFHGPKGVGAAYIRGDDYGLPPMSAFMHGGEQEHGLRAGTLAVHNIVGFGKAAELAIANEQRQIACIQKLEQTAKKIIASNEHLELLGDSEHHLPGVISLIVNLEDFDNERFVKRISAKFAVSTGSACTAGMPSHVLQAIGKGDAVSRVLRISLSAENTIDQVESFLKELSLYNFPKGDDGMSLRTVSFQDTYWSGENDLIKEFYVPCMEESIEYCRAVGYFHSSIFCYITNGLYPFIQHGGRMRIVCSVNVSPEDEHQIALGYDIRQLLEDKIAPATQELIDLNIANIKNLCWLIKNNRLDIKVCLRKDPNTPGAYRLFQ